MRKPKNLSDPHFPTAWHREPNSLDTTSGHCPSMGVQGLAPVFLHAERFYTRLPC